MNNSCSEENFIPQEIWSGTKTPISSGGHLTPMESEIFAKIKFSGLNTDSLLALYLEKSVKSIRRYTASLRKKGLITEVGKKPNYRVSNREVSIWGLPSSEYPPFQPSRPKK